jgi:DNA-binding LacI/PurR family transcriptional regulator
MSKITIKKIAELAGVSVPAVSYVLNGKKGVSEETRQRILAIIEDMEYTPNVNSRRLILKRSFNILVSLDTSVSTLNNFFYTEVLNAIVSKATELGYNTVLSSDTESQKKENLIDALQQGNADGVIFLRDIPSSLQERIEKAGAPFVVVDSQKTQPAYPCIRCDSEHASYIATKYLIDQGHRKIAFIGMDRLPDFYIRAFGGYCHALADGNLPIQSDWIQAGAYDEASAQRCMQDILDSPELPTAIYCAGDIFAIGAMNYLQDHGYAVPRDFSITSIDDIVLSRYYHPPLTTVQIDKCKMGTLAVEMLDHLIVGETVDPVVSIASDQLIVRKTVAPGG